MNAAKRLIVAMTIPFATINPPDTPVSAPMATSCKRMEGHVSVSILCHVGTTEGGEGGGVCTIDLPPMDCDVNFNMSYAARN